MSAQEDIPPQPLVQPAPVALVTWALVIANIAIYIVMVAKGVPPFDPPADVLIRWGADYGPLTVHGQWWRVVTSAFVHVGLLHLLVNMVSLASVGRFAEAIFGRAGFTALYFLGAIAGSMTSLAVHPVSASSGASGAVFAVFGAPVGFVLVRRSTMPPGVAASLLKTTIGFFVINLLYGLLKENVNVAAHIGGFVAGIAIGCALAAPLPIGTTPLRRSAMVAIVGVVLAAAAATRLPRYDDWVAEFTRWTTMDRQRSDRFSALIEELRDGKLTPDQFSARVDREVLAPMDAQRAKMASLRVAPGQTKLARDVINYAAIKTDALRLMARGQHDRNPALVRDGTLKHEEALAALYAFAPDPRLAARIEELKTNRALEAEYAAAMTELAALEDRTGKLYNQAFRRERARGGQPKRFAGTIESDILRPWEAEQKKLSALRVPPTRQAHFELVMKYVGLRTDGWRLIVEGMRANDTAKIKEGTAKHAEAMKVGADVGGAASPPPAAPPR